MKFTQVLAFRIQIPMSRASNVFKLFILVKTFCELVISLSPTILKQKNKSGGSAQYIKRFMACLVPENLRCLV